MSGIGQIDGEDGIVVADVGAQQQRLHAVDQQLETREIARVAMENAVGPPADAPMSPWLSSTAKQSPCLSVRRGRVEGPVAGM